MIEQEASMPSKRDPEKAVAAMSRPGRRKPLAEALNELIARGGAAGARRRSAGSRRRPGHADIVFVGEQPGDQEDRAGRPFVGPPAKLLDRGDGRGRHRPRPASIVTNAVKHFKFEQRGKRRIHQKPTIGEVKHYRWWLMKELDLVHPKLRWWRSAAPPPPRADGQGRVAVTKARGQASFENRPGCITTCHPSYLLRIPDEADKRRPTRNSSPTSEGFAISRRRSSPPPPQSRSSSQG